MTASKITNLDHFYIKCSFCTYCLIIIVLWGCGEDQILSEDKLTTARLQAVTFIGEELIAVSDTAYDSGQWGEGRIIIANIEDKKAVATWYTSLENPQKFLRHGEELAVLNSGSLNLTQEQKAHLSSLTTFDIDENNELIFKDNFYIHNRPIGSYLVDLASSLTEGNVPHKDYYLTSGIDGVLFKVQTPHGSIADQSTQLQASRFAELNQISLASVRAWKDLLLVMDFNEDRLYFYTPDGQMKPCAPTVGAFEGVMEGAQTPFITEDQLWLSFGLSGRLSQIDLSELDLNDSTCAIDEVVYDPALGQVPNDLIVLDQKVFILHSGESALWVYDRQSGQRSGTYKLPAQTNPWQMALSPDQQILAITEWYSGGLILFNLATETIERLTPKIFSPKPPNYCAFPDQWDGIEYLIDSSKSEEIFFWSDIEKALNHQAKTTSQNLRQAPQLALLLGKQTPPFQLEVKVTEMSDWVVLQPQDSHLFASLNTQKPPSSAESSTQGWQLESNFQPLSWTLLLNQDESSTLEVPFDQPCDLFLPQYRALTFDITSALNRENNIEIRDGKVPLYAVKIKLLNPDENESLNIKSLVYRHWIHP